ncbi:hypothetical protein C8F04DRAFT_1329188 [Mycena alexandri]|uniref:Uncharacterized protein n=1 Tax=Mycena alexandri TaxID=1745969 RepID=A0AAD6RZJ1_9AGAR|nr:hypothetical protein C8F04DRAFT_1329188 [Mycena alexandri]
MCVKTTVRPMEKHFYLWGFEPGLIACNLSTCWAYSSEIKPRLSTNLIGTDTLSAPAIRIHGTGPSMLPSVSLATRSLGIGSCSGTPCLNRRHGSGATCNLGSLVWVFFYDPGHMDKYNNPGQHGLPRKTAVAWAASRSDLFGLPADRGFGVCARERRGSILLLALILQWHLTAPNGYVPRRREVLGILISFQGAADIGIERTKLYTPQALVINLQTFRNEYLRNSVQNGTPSEQRAIGPIKPQIIWAAAREENSPPDVSNFDLVAVPKCQQIRLLFKLTAVAYPPKLGLFYDSEQLLHLFNDGSKRKAGPVSLLVPVSPPSPFGSFQVNLTPPNVIEQRQPALGAIEKKKQTWHTCNSRMLSRPCSWPYLVPFYSLSEESLAS